MHPRPRQESNSGLGSQEVFCLLLNSELHCHVLISLLSAPVLRQMNPRHIQTLFFRSTLMLPLVYS